MSKNDTPLWLVAVRVASKAIRFSRGGFNTDEKKELADDLLDLAGQLLEELNETN